MLVTLRAEYLVVLNDWLEGGFLVLAVDLVWIAIKNVEPALGQTLTVVSHTLLLVCLGLR